MKKKPDDQSECHLLYVAAGFTDDVVGKVKDILNTGTQQEKRVNKFKTFTKLKFHDNLYPAKSVLN